MITAAGLVIRAWAASWIIKDRELATSGPYAHTRNPLYLGSFLLGVGATVAGGQPTFIVLFLVFFAVVYTKTMLVEAEKMAETFGDTYRRYAESVPLFFPRLRAAERTSVGRAFDVQRYRHNREYEALLGAVGAFALLAVKMLWMG